MKDRKAVALHKLIPVAALLVMMCILITGCGSGSDVAESENTYKDQVYPLERNGIDIHLDCMKADGVDIKDNILLVHGLTYSSHEFDVNYKDYSLVRFLCDNGYAVWRIDISGYGQSERVENGFTVDSRYASEDICLAIDRILEISKAEDIDLLGWSWGTVTSSLAEQKADAKIDRFVLYAPILSGLGAENIEEDYHVNSWEHVATDFQKNEDGSIDTTIVEMPVVDIYCSNSWRYDKDKSPNGGRRDLCVDPETELIDLAAINSPTLVICGDKDPYMNMSLVEASEDSLPEGSRLEIVKGAAHAMYIEKPYYHMFQEKLIDFLTCE